MFRGVKSRQRRDLQQNIIKMSAIDPFVVNAKERIKYQEQFNSLNPINGIITGQQAKGFLLQSQLPPLVLGQIW